jgi:hypothetical protein
VKALLSVFIFREHEIGLPGYRVFEKLNRMGRLLLIFDGFDEMAARMDQQKMVKNFWELTKVIVPGSKVILTCRTSFFRYSREADEVLKGNRMGQVVIDYSDKPQFEVVNLELFNRQKVYEALCQRLGDTEGETAFNRLSQTYDLEDLAQRPILLEMISETISHLQSERKVNAADIYRLCIDQWIAKSFEEGRTFVNAQAKRFIMREFAWEMYCTGTSSIHHSELLEHATRHYLSMITTSCAIEQSRHRAYSNHVDRSRHRA